MGGDKIVLLDGAGANGGGGAATNGLLSMIPGMFANLIRTECYKKHQSRHNKQRRCPSCQDRGL